MEKSLKKYFLIFALPTLAAFLIAFFIPFVTGTILSFTEFKVVNDAQWVGFSNYIKIFTQDSEFLNALFLTVKFTFVSIITVNVFAFRLLCFLRENLREQTFSEPFSLCPTLLAALFWAIYGA